MLDEATARAARHHLALAAHRGTADGDQVLASLERLPDTDAHPDDWVREWTTAGGASWAAGNAALARGNRVTARSQLLRAATYYDAALVFVPASSEPEREPALRDRQRECWSRATGTLDPPAEAAGDGAWLVPAAGRDPRPAVVVDPGGAASRAWAIGGAAAAERGYHWVAVGGGALTGVFDVLLARPDVDPAAVAAVGVGPGAHRLLRALAGEHRIAAAVADPGVRDAAAAVTAALPAALAAPLRAGDGEAFDRELRLLELFEPDAAARLQVRARALGLDALSHAALTDATRGRLAEADLAAVTTPLLITDPDDEPAWPGQAQALRDALRPGVGELRALASAEGAAGREAAIFDWLGERLAPAPTLSAESGP